MAETVQSLRAKALEAMRKADNYKASGDTKNEQAWRTKYNTLKAQADALEKAQAAATKKTTAQSALEKATAELADAQAKAKAGVPGAPQLVKEKQAALNKLKGIKETTAQSSDAAKAAADKAAAAKAAADKAAADKAAAAKKAGTDKAAADKAAAEKAAADKAAAAKADATKTTWMNYLRETFKNIGDPKAQAQINALFAEASKPGSGWTEQSFMDALNQIPWWQQQLPSLQNYFLLSHDPRQSGTLQEARIQKTDYIKTLMGKLGVELNNVDPTTGKIIDNSNVLSGIVEKAIANNWTDSQIEHYMAQNSTLHFTQGGVIGSNLDLLQKNARLYGVTLDPVLTSTIQSDLVDPTSGRDSNYWINQFKNMAMSSYKPFAKAIQDGGNMYTATYNYRTQMANLLEVSPEAITWKDLMGGVIDPTTGNARTEDDFTKQVKQNPLWQRTANARQTYMGVANDLMSMFGITG